MHGVQSLSNELLLLFAFIYIAKPESTTFYNVESFMLSISLIRESFLESSKLSESINISVKLYSFARSRLIPSTSLEVLTT